MIKEYVWLSNPKKLKVKCSCGNRLTVNDINFLPEINVPAIKTMTKNRFYEGPEGKREILNKYLHKGAHGKKGIKNVDQSIK